MIKFHFLKFLVIFFFIANSLCSELNQLQGTKGYNEGCNWRILGTQCKRGLVCSKRYGVCLKKDGEHCNEGKECVGRKCWRNKCH